MLKHTIKNFGYQQITDLSSSTGLTVPAKDSTDLTGPTYALIIAETQTVRWRDDGTAPTASVGMPLLPNVPLVYDGDLSKIKFIEATSGAKLNISYYS